jgi:hypothetical protein
MKVNWLLLSIVFWFGFLVGALLIYKVEINTINQAFESLRYCYETYGGFE